MAESSSWRAIRIVLRGLNLLRLTILNIVFFALLILVLVALASIHAPPRVVEPHSAVLVVRLRGKLVEEAHNPVARAVRRIEGLRSGRDIVLGRLLRAIRVAARDPRIHGLVLETEGFAGGGMPELGAVRRALLDFRHRGKPVVAYGRHGFSEAAYYLASVATRIDMGGDGAVDLEGFGMQVPYMASLLHRLGVHVYVTRVGKYKDAVEPFLRNSMSASSRAQWTAYFDALWGTYVRRVEASRHLPPESLEHDLAAFVPDLRAVHGNAARLALAWHLVDRLVTRRAFRAYLTKRFGHAPHGRGYAAIGWRRYLYLHPRPGPGNRPEVALIHASGDIVSGSAPPGTIGSRTLVRLIDRARRDPRVKALVLRVDSPGGSALASDEILHALEAFRESGKAFVVSMGNMAASGGYWISMAAQRIYASPTTLTGSIGIFGIVPDFAGTLKKIGVHVGGVGTTPLAFSTSMLTPWTPEGRAIFRMEVLDGYRRFIDNVARFRHMTPARVNAIGRGHIWVATTALHLGLVDRLGGLRAAEAEAAKLAKISPHYAVVRFKPVLTPYERLLIHLSRMHGTSEAAPGGWSWATLLGRGGFRVGAAVWLARHRRLFRPLAVLFHSSRPGIYAYCPCAYRVP
jgi:protease-4